MVPLELESRTEKDSRMLCKSWGGSFERLSFCERPLETCLRGSRPAALFVIDRLDVSYFDGDAGCDRWSVGDGGGSVCALLKDGAQFVLDGVDMTISSSSSSSSETV